MRLKVYQTLEDRDNPDKVEEDAPYHCNIKTAWLGNGYYVWDTFLETAHWWGESRHDNNYIICQGLVIMTEVNCWDIHGNTNHIEELNGIIEAIVKAGIGKRDDILVRDIIEFLKKKGKFAYEAIRANSILKWSEKDKKIYFHLVNPAYMLLKPKIQFCLLNKRALSLQNMRIVYPEKYTIGYAS